MKQTNRKGFTLAELLIVVAIIAVLVAIAIPVFTSQLHNARVAAEVANCRAFYAELQAYYIETGERNKTVPTVDIPDLPYNWKSFTFLNGDVVNLKEGIFSLRFDTEKGYFGLYNCDKNHHEHVFEIGKQ